MFEDTAKGSRKKMLKEIIGKAKGKAVGKSVGKLAGLLVPPQVRGIMIAAKAAGPVAKKAPALAKKMGEFMKK